MEKKNINSSLPFFMNEKDLNVKYGMINLREEREMARTSLKYILTDVYDIKKTYIRLGFHLIEFNRCKYYEDFGYNTFAEFCDANIPLDKSAISRCMSVCDAFCIKDTPFSAPKMFLQDKYKDYTYSQLVEMVSMKEDCRSKIKPSMTIKEIREIKKKNVSRKNDDVSQVATSQLVDEKRLTVIDLCTKKGAVLYNRVKECKSLERIKICLFDSSGKYTEYRDVFCDVLMSGSIGDDRHVYLRLVDTIGEKDD